jgi:hypothetical protein
MRARLPMGTRVGLNDAGAIPLVSGLKALDLVGLTSNDPWALAYREGPGSLFEAIEHLPLDRRPDVLAIYPSWIGLPDLYGEKIHEAKIEDNRTAAEATTPLFRFRADVLGSGARPALPHAGQIIDELDVADLESERPHGFAIDRPAWTIYRRERYQAQPSLTVSDGGRVMRRFARARLRVRPGHAARLVIRSDAWVDVVLGGTVDGVPIARINIPQARAFVEPELVLPAATLRRPEVDVNLELIAGRELSLFHLWVVQEP